MKKIILAVFALFLGWAVWQRLHFFRYCIHDDAFISFRYARNLARGEGLVMNAGERVEGITNFFWTLLVTPAFVLGFDPEVIFIALGGALSLAIIGLVFVFSYRKLQSGWFALVAPAFLIGNLAFTMESLSALETMAYTLAVLASIYLFVQQHDTHRYAWVWACGIATLLRPEGVLVFGLLWLGSIVVSGGRVSRRSLFVTVGVYLLLVLPLFLWRWAYYGEPLPNTFYTKVGYTLAQVERGWRYSRFMFIYILTLPLFVLALASAVFSLAYQPLRTSREAPRRKASWWHPYRVALAVLLCLLVSYVLYVTIIGGDYEPTARFFMPVLPLFYLLLQEGMRGVAAWARRRRRWVAASAMVLVVFVLGAGWQLSSSNFAALLQRRGWPESRYAHHLKLRMVGEWLHRGTPADARIALSSVGAIPYYADRPILDMMGLTEPTIGRRQMSQMGQGAAGHEKGDGAFVLRQQPDIVLFDRGHWFEEAVSLERVLRGARGISETDLAESETFLHQYTLQRRHLPQGVLHYFLRNPLVH